MWHSPDVATSLWFSENNLPLQGFANITEVEIYFPSLLYSHNSSIGKHVFKTKVLKHSNLTSWHNSKGKETLLNVVTELY